MITININIFSQKESVIDGVIWDNVHEKVINVLAFFTVIDIVIFYGYFSAALMYRS